jgi:hypothetical protein
MTLDPDAGEVFGWVGLNDTGEHYVAATGIYDYFWSLSRETREKLIWGWIESLEYYLDPEVAAKVQENVTEGDLVYYIHDEVVEGKPSSGPPAPPGLGVVIPFPKKP